MYNFCTLFNSLYLSRGLAMITSLNKTCPSFHLYIFAFDDLCYNTLKRLNLENVTVISLQEFEDPELLKIKSDRTPGEYCWTCTPSTIKYCIEQFSLDNCTYIDADLYFFSNPAVLFDELGNASVMITDHRYTPGYDQSATYGKYCVQFITFKNDTNGMKVLNWWRDACLVWCYNRVEDNKFGDQKYLDNWTTMFDGVHELQHLGGGVAPWNIQQYNTRLSNGKLTATETATGKSFDVVFYHYHHFKYLEGKGCHLGYYEIDMKTTALIYGPYITALQAADKQLEQLQPGHLFHEEMEVPRLKKSLRRKYLYHIKGKFRKYYKQQYILRLWRIYSA